MVDKIDTDKLIGFLRALREHSYEVTGSNGESIHRFDETTVSFDVTGHFLCYTTVRDGVIYSFYSDLAVQRSDSSGVNLVEKDEDFSFLNSRIKSEWRELEFGPSFD